MLHGAALYVPGAGGQAAFYAVGQTRPEPLVREPLCGLSAGGLPPGTL